MRNQSDALRKEKELKKLKHQQKISLAASWSEPMKIDPVFDQYHYLTRAPGRVNLLGEHIDYNGGPVLPAALDRYVYLGANPRDDHLVCLKALDLDQEITFSIESLWEKKDSQQNPLPEWALYPAGVAATAMKNGLKVEGINAVFSSNVPIGAGLSSSAAVEVAFAALWRELGDWDLDNLVLAKLCQEAENSYVGVNCGLMDQFASANGVANAALLFDSQEEIWDAIDIPDNTAIIIADSKIRRSLANSAYNDRRRDCEHALEILKHEFPKIRSLADVTPEDFETHAHGLPETIQKRARHVIYECSRVNQAAEFLRAGNLESFGRLMTETHNSLRDLFEVSIPELDLLVEIANRQPGCYGARLTGAGFGGCTVSLVSERYVGSFIKALEEEYLQETGLKADVYHCKASDGVKVFWRKLD